MLTGTGQLRLFAELLLGAKVGPARKAWSMSFEGTKTTVITGLTLSFVVGLLTSRSGVLRPKPAFDCAMPLLSSSPTPSLYFWYWS